MEKNYKFNQSDIGQVTEFGILLATEFQHVVGGKKIGPKFNYFVVPYHDENLADLPKEEDVIHTVNSFPKSIVNPHAPTRLLLSGLDEHGVKKNPDNMYAHRDAGAFNGFLNRDSSLSSIYLSCTRDGGGRVHAVNFSDKATANPNVIINFTDSSKFSLIKVVGILCPD